MKFKKPTIIFPLLCFIILTSIGILFAVRARQSPDPLMAVADTRQSLKYKNPSTENRHYPSELINLSTTQFEPLLLLMLGTGLLLIVTGIKMFHSRKLQLPLDSTSPTATRPKQPLGLPLSKGKHLSS